MSKTQNPEIESQSEILGFKKDIPLDRIRAPERSDKLHPYEDEPEDEEDLEKNFGEQNTWDEFRESVGTEPNKPLEVRPAGPYDGVDFDVEEYDGDYEIIDGDRRFRALNENDADTVACFIVDASDDIQRGLRMFEANNFSRPNSSEQEAQWIARFYQPSLLLPGDRIQDKPIFGSASNAASVMGVSDATVTNRLDDIRREYPIRGVLTGNEYATNGTSLTEEEVQIIDETWNYLKKGGEFDNPVVAAGQEDFVASELGKMGGQTVGSPSLGNIRKVAKKAAEEGWDHTRFLEHLHEKYYQDEEEQKEEKERMRRVEENVDAGMMDGSGDPLGGGSFEDDSGGVSVDDVEVESEERDEPTIELERPDLSANWSQYVSDDDLDTAISEHKSRRMMSQTIEDEAAVAINVFADKYNVSVREVMKAIVEPAIFEEITSRLEVEN